MRELNLMKKLRNIGSSISANPNDEIDPDYLVPVSELMKKGVRKRTPGLYPEKRTLNKRTPCCRIKNYDRGFSYVQKICKSRVFSRRGIPAKSGRRNQSRNRRMFWLDQRASKAISHAPKKKTAIDRTWIYSTPQRTTAKRRSR